MKRRQVFGAVAGAGAVTAIGSYSAAAQDEDLEARVAELEEQMEAVLARLDALEGGNGSSEDNEGSESSGRSIDVSGSGKDVSNDFVLAAGRYEVAATCTLVDNGIGMDNFIVQIYGPDQEDLLFNELIESDWDGSAVYEAEDDGDHYVEVTTEGDWTLTFTPR